MGALRDVQSPHETSSHGFSPPVYTCLRINGATGKHQWVEASADVISDFVGSAGDFAAAGSTSNTSFPKGGGKEGPGGSRIG